MVLHEPDDLQMLLWVLNGDIGKMGLVAAVVE
jgi:hypothetical protein